MLEPAGACGKRLAAASERLGSDFGGRRRHFWAHWMSCFGRVSGKLFWSRKEQSIQLLAQVGGTWGTHKPGDAIMSDFL